MNDCWRESLFSNRQRLYYDIPPTHYLICFCGILASPSEVSQRGGSTSTAQISSNGLVVRSWSYPVRESPWVLKVTDSSRGLFVGRSCVYTVGNDEPAALQQNLVFPHSFFIFLTYGSNSTVKNLLFIFFCHSTATDNPEKNTNLFQQHVETKVKCKQKSHVINGNYSTSWRTGVYWTLFYYKIKTCQVQIVTGTPVVTLKLHCYVQGWHNDSLQYRPIPYTDSK